MTNSSSKDALDVLNRALALDKKAVHSLYDFRVECSQELADDPDREVSQEEYGRYTIYFLGLLNGFLFADNERIAFLVENESG